MAGDSRVIADQASKYSAATGQSASTDVLRDIAEFARDAVPMKLYKAHPEVPFWYEVLDKHGWSEKVVLVVDEWANDKNNLVCAAEQVRRPLNSAGPELIRKYCILRFKMRQDTEWTSIPEGLGIDDLPQTVVIIALEDLNPENGFFMHLKCGQHVCIDGKDSIYRPPTGGGLGLWMVLSI